MGKDVSGLSAREEAPNAATCKRIHGTPKAIAKMLATTPVHHVLRAFTSGRLIVPINSRVKSTKEMLQLSESRF